MCRHTADCEHEKLLRTYYTDTLAVANIFVGSDAGWPVVEISKGDELTEIGRILSSSAEHACTGLKPSTIGR